MLKGRYEVIGELSSGGMGRLHLARAAVSGRLVVIKVPHTKEDDERLRDEARVGMRLVHPHIVETLDLLDLDGRPGLVTAYVSGTSLLDLRKKNALPAAVVCRVGRQIADALDAIHGATDEAGRSLHILHRDVTPANIMLGHDGKARLIDLGIARSVETKAERTAVGSVRGTIRYLAPELFSNASQSPQTDLWSLGVVLWEALRGKEAVTGSPATAIGKILAGDIMKLPDGERVDVRVQKAIAQMLRMDPKDRPQRARDVAAMFAMLEKDIGGARNLDELAAACVIAAVGPPSDGVDDPARVMARARAVFGEAARMHTTGISDADIVAEESVGAPAVVEGTLLEPEPHANARPASPSVPSEAIRNYTKMLKSLERR